jgi:hypothetical protein
MFRYEQNTAAVLRKEIAELEMEITDIDLGSAQEKAMKACEWKRRSMGKKQKILKQVREVVVIGEKEAWGSKCRRYWNRWGRWWWLEKEEHGKEAEDIETGERNTYLLNNICERKILGLQNSIP